MVELDVEYPVAVPPKFIVRTAEPEYEHVYVALLASECVIFVTETSPAVEDNVPPVPQST